MRAEELERESTDGIIGAESRGECWREERR
jgi:hypothetical protein